MGTYTADTVQLEVKHAYLDFVIPNTPVSVMAGIQAFEFGGRLWQNIDSPGIKVMANFAPHTLTAFMWRENDGGINLAGGESVSANARRGYAVNDTYGLEYKLVQKAFNVSAFAA